MPVFILLPVSRVCFCWCLWFIHIIFSFPPLCVSVLLSWNKSFWPRAIDDFSFAFAGGLEMFLVPGGFTEKRAQFFRVDSPESGLQPFSEELIYRFMKMFETGQGSVSGKWESTLRTRGLAQRSLGREVVGKVKCMRIEWSVPDLGLCPGLWDSAV